jgi:menaquinone-9 beta-reductase
MPTRRTKRGTARTQLSGDADVLVCGASFAGLVVARELADARARGGGQPRVLMVDRYEIGERQTSACAAPTRWLEALGLERSMRQTFRDLVIHTPHGSARYRLPFTFSTFDYASLCALLNEQNDAVFDTAKVEGRAPGGVSTDRGEITAPLVVDGLGWRRVLATDGGYQPPEAPLSRGLEVHPGGNGRDLEIWIDRSYVRAGYSWSFPARDELRIGVGSFDPRQHVKDSTVRLADDLGSEAVRYQGNWIPHRLRPAAEDGVFFAGDSAGHCLPLTAEGIRTAFYFGIAAGRGLRDVVEGRTTRERALARYARFSARHRHAFEALLRAQRLVPEVPPRILGSVIRALGNRRFVDWSFGHYLTIAPPSFVEGRRPPAQAPSVSPRAAAALRSPAAHDRASGRWCPAALARRSTW